MNEWMNEWMKQTCIISKKGKVQSCWTDDEKINKTKRIVPQIRNNI